MIKARSRKISMLLVLAMLMTMFVGVGTASAAAGFSATDAPIVTEGANQRLGTIIGEFYNVPAGKNGIIVKLPADFEFQTKPTVSFLEGEAEATVIDDVYNKNQMTVIIETESTQSELKFAISLNNIIKVPSDAPEDIYAKLMATPGSIFPDGAVLVGRTSSAAVDVVAGDKVTVTAGGLDGKRIEINFRENKAKAIEPGNKTLTLKLPRGFEWVKDDPVFFTVANDTTIQMIVEKIDARTLHIHRPSLLDTVPAAIWKFVATDIIVDETVASVGDIEVTIGGATNLKTTSVVIGEFAEYGVTVTAKDAPELIAGREKQEIADIKIKENIGDSIHGNRTVYMTLPSGVRWVADNNNKVSYALEVSDGLKINGDIKVLNNKPEVAKFVFDAGTPAKGEITIKDAQIDVAPDFTGDIVVELSGNAGLNDKLTVATVIAPVTLSADVKEVKIGLQKQPGGNIVITETKAENLLASKNISVSLGNGVVWGTTPTVKVVEGDVELGTPTKSGSILTIPVKNTSSKPSKIEISDVTYTVDRTVPEGEVKVSVRGSALIDLTTVFDNRDSVASVVAMEVVTPAPGETIGSGEFRIGSNIYYVGGNAKVMDVAPYIKDSRTYVPMRYLGEILGAEVVWDDAARTVTLTKGDDVVVFTIGSTTYTVNGETKTADVAPEITNSRTMLPARFVAEAFGAVVGWDAATQTVLIQK